MAGQQIVLSDGDVSRIVAEARPGRIVVVTCWGRDGDTEPFRPTAEVWLSEEGLDRLRALLDEAG